MRPFELKVHQIHGNGCSWKGLENAHKKLLESPEKPLSVFCMHRVYNFFVGYLVCPHTAALDRLRVVAVDLSTTSGPDF